MHTHPSYTSPLYVKRSAHLQPLILVSSGHSGAFWMSGLASYILNSRSHVVTSIPITPSLRVFGSDCNGSSSDVCSSRWQRYCRDRELLVVTSIPKSHPACEYFVLGGSCAHASVVCVSVCVCVCVRARAYEVQAVKACRLTVHLSARRYTARTHFGSTGTGTGTGTGPGHGHGPGTGTATPYSILL